MESETTINNNINNETVKNDFINKFIDYITTNKIKKSKNKLNIELCRMVAILNQQLLNYTDLIKDIADGYYKFYKFEENIQWEDKEDGEIAYKSTLYVQILYQNISYQINFYDMDRYIGGCDCTPLDFGYNKKYRCCGINCKWDAPKISLTKCVEYPCFHWEGNQKDFWEFIDDFELKQNGITEAKLKEVKRFEINEKKRLILDNIEQLQAQLKALDENK